MSISQNFPSISPSMSMDFANTKKLDSRVTFARASGAVYYDGQTVAKAEENLLLRSQEFDNAGWTKSNVTVTANTTTAPDGTTSAELMFPTTTGVNRAVQQAGNSTVLTTAIPKTFSIFAKASGKSHINLFDALNGGQRTWFNLSAGTVGTTAAGYTASIVDAGNGWHRCIVTTSVAWVSSGLLGWATSDADNSSTATTNGTDGILIWGAQLEQRDAVTAYTPTTTQPITRFQPVLESEPANVARFDHNPVTGESLGLLVEELRTNLLQRSEEFNNAYWTKTSCSITANTIVAPDGTLTGDKLVENTAGVGRDVRRTLSSTAGAYSFSVYAKYAGRVLRLQVNSNSNSDFVIADFDLQVGTSSVSHTSPSGVSGVSAKIEDVGNGVFRCSVIATYANALSLGIIRPVPSVGFAPSGIYTGDGFSGIFIWGASLEQGAFPTSYIKTVASQVTRAADSASMVGANFSEWYRQDEGTLYGEFVEAFNSVQFASNSGGLSLNTNSTLPIIEIMPKQTVIDFNARGVGAGATSGVALPSPASFRPAGTVSRVALTYITDPLGTVTAGSLNGTVATNATKTANSMTGINQLEIGKQVISGITIGTRYFRKVSYYPIAVTSAQLQALTS